MKKLQATQAALKTSLGGTAVLSAHEVSYNPPPDMCVIDSLTHVGSYVLRFLAVSKGCRHLLVFTPDGGRGVGLWNRGGQISVFITIQKADGPDTEGQVRRLFDQFGCVPKRDLAATTGNPPEPVRYLLFDVGSSANDIVALVTGILTKIYGVGECDPLEMTLYDSVR
jgi:hypothetical protein